MYSGLQYQKGNIKSKKFFFQTPYANWFTESVKRTGYKWFLNDTSIYFTGFPLKKSGRVDTNRFLGYRHNMVSWIYKDPNQWENKAKKHKKNTQYAKFCKDFVPEGVFWKRERSKYESFRREGGIEGYGGDKLFASTELIRYILFSLFLNGNHHPSQKLGHPYISTWSLPILVNAITAYIELGYLSIKRDRWILTNKQNEIAEGIAVGIYSLLVGLKPKNKKFKYGPIGKSIDLSKYNLSTGESYFEIVVPE